MGIVFEQIRTGGDRNLAYLLADPHARVAAAIDPSFAPGRVLERARAQGLSIAWVLCTHGHADHVNGNEELVGQTGARVAAHPACPARADAALADGEALALGALRVHALHVPGHAPDHLLLHLPAWGIALTGDHLFVGKVGGTAGEEEARAQYDSLARTLRALPDETTVWPGHDYGCRPSSTIGLERATNPFLRAGSLAAFLALKRDWAAHKAAHGLV